MSTEKSNTTETAMTADPLLATVISQLDKWIEDSEKKSDSCYQLKNLTGNQGMQYFNGMAQAYWNIKQFIQVNYNQKTN